MAVRWLAAAERHPIAPTLAVALGLAISTSCVLPSYSVGDASSSTASGDSSSGAGGGRSSSTASVGPGGAGIGGSGIGGTVDCGGSMTDVLVGNQGSPHGLAVSSKHVFWIADPDNTVYYTTRSGSTATKIALNGVCGISAGTVNGKDEVVMRKADGSIRFSSDPFDIVVQSAAAGGGPLGDDGTCAISLDANDLLYGFDIQDGAYRVMQYPLTNQLPTLIVAAMGTPVAIDATDKTYVAWAEADHDMGAFFVAAKANGAIAADLPGAPTVQAVCAEGELGSFAYSEPGASVINTWAKSAPSGYLISGVVATHLACTSAHHVWSEDESGCSTLKNLDKMTGTPKTIATKQPRVCSIAIAGNDVYWTTCEPKGGVHKTTLSK